MNAVVRGTISHLSALETITDWSSVKKVRQAPLVDIQIVEMYEQYHKLNAEQAVQETSGSSRCHAIIDNIVISSVAMKSVMA